MIAIHKDSSASGCSVLNTDVDQKLTLQEMSFRDISSLRIGLSPSIPWPGTSPDIVKAPENIQKLSRILYSGMTIIYEISF